MTLDEMQAAPWVLEQGWPEQLTWLRSLGLDTDRLNATTLPNEELAHSAARQGYGLYVINEALVSADIEFGQLLVRGVRTRTPPPIIW